jgi:hypothetical protein
MENMRLHVKNNYKYLDIQIDRKFNFSTHVKELKSKLQKRVIP